MEGKTAEELQKADPRSEQDAPGWADALGMGALWSTVANQPVRPTPASVRRRRKI